MNISFNSRAPSLLKENVFSSFSTRYKAILIIASIAIGFLVAAWYVVARTDFFGSIKAKLKQKNPKDLLNSTLKVGVASLSKDIGKGVMLKNPELCANYNLANKILVQKKDLCTECYSINLQSSSDSKTSTMAFPNSNSMQKIISQEIIKNLQECKEYPPAEKSSQPQVEILDNLQADDTKKIDESRSKFAKALAKELYEQYAKRTESDRTGYLSMGQSDPAYGYVYEIIGTMKRQFSNTSKDSETLQAKFNFKISVAFFNTLAP